MGIAIDVLASGSGGNCYRVCDGETPLLLECGIPIRKIKKKLNFTLSEIAGCLISHSHLDHALSSHEVAEAGVDVYLTLPTKGALRLKSHRAKVIIPKKTFQVGTWMVRPFETEHDCEGSVGFYMHSTVAKERLVFLTDSYYSKYTFKDVSVWMLEVNYDAETLRQSLEEGAIDDYLKGRVLKSHMSLENVLELLQANDLSKTKRVYAIHLSDTNSDRKLIKRKLQEATGKEIIVC